MGARSPERPAARLRWIDDARGWGMALVFAGHLAERMAASGWQAALAPYQLVYAFHMPLFFLLAGMTTRLRVDGIAASLKRLVVLRLVPVAFWNAAAVSLLLASDLLRGGSDAEVYREGLTRLALGRPLFHFVSWFFVCLFVVEAVRTTGSRWLGSRRRIAGAAALAYGLGWLATRPEPGAAAQSLAADPWYLREALVALAFHLGGTLLRPALERLAAAPRTLRLALVVPAAAALVAGAARNTGPFTGEPHVVLMAAGRHGDPLWFPLAALAGSLACILIAMLTPRGTLLAWIGRHSAIFLGLAGLFAQFGNRWLLTPFAGAAGDAPASVLGLCAAGTALSLALCAPAAWLLDRLLPQLVGRPARSGPWLPRLS